MSTAKPKHIGRNISRIRELRQMKQEALAQAEATHKRELEELNLQPEDEAIPRTDSATQVDVQHWVL